MPQRCERSKAALHASAARAPARIGFSARSLACLAGLAMGLEAGVPRAAEPSADAPRVGPNVLLISLDATRADFLTFRDRETAPHMTGLAERGTVFTGAISGTSWTLPAHAQMFTGMAPPFHGAESSDVAIDPLMTTLPELLDAAGYFTSGVFTARSLSADSGFARGFDVYRSGMLRAHPVRAEAESIAPRGFDEAEQLRLPGSRDDVSSERVVALTRMALERATPDQPVFLFAHFFDPHADWVPPPPFDTRFDPDYDGPITGRDVLANRAIIDPASLPHRRVDDRGLEHLKALYRGEIAWTDQAVGQILDMLAQHRRLEDTLIVITADHGEAFFEHDALTHRMDLHDETIRVPLLVVLPRSWDLPVTPEVSAQVTLSDLLPTIADLLDLEAPGGVTGRSLVPAIRGEPFDSRPELISLYTTNDRGGGQRQHLQSYGLRTPQWKFVRTAIVEPGEPMRVQGELYDLVHDPAEKRPLADQGHSAVRKQWAALEAELDRARAAWRDGPRTPRRDRSADSLAQLRALGGVDEGEAIGGLGPPRPWGLAPMDPIELEAVVAWRRWLLWAALALVLAVVARLVLRSRAGR